ASAALLHATCGVRAESDRPASPDPAYEGPTESHERPGGLICLALFGATSSPHARHPFDVGSTPPCQHVRLDAFGHFAAPDGEARRAVRRVRTRSGQCRFRPWSP